MSFVLSLAAPEVFQVYVDGGPGTPTPLDQVLGVSRLRAAGLGKMCVCVVNMGIVEVGGGGDS